MVDDDKQQKLVTATKNKILDDDCLKIENIFYINKSITYYSVKLSHQPENDDHYCYL